MLSMEWSGDTAHGRDIAAMPLEYWELAQICPALVEDLSPHNALMPHDMLGQHLYDTLLAAMPSTKLHTM